MNHWYLFDEAGLHRGPLSTEALVSAIQAGEVALDTRIATETWAGESSWRPAHTVAEVAELIELRKSEARETETTETTETTEPTETTETTERKLNIVPGAFTTDRRGTLDFGSTVMMIPKTGDEG